MGPIIRLLVLLCLLATGADASSLPTPSQAPLSESFKSYLAGSTAAAKSAVVERTTGYLPAPVDRSHLIGRSTTALASKAAVLPTVYDLRSLGRVTPVKDQGSCGACWAFGSLASLESVLLPGEQRDFSENHLKNTSGFSWDACSGGNGDMAVAYLARWGGPVNEAEDPYSETSAVSPTGLQPRKHLRQALILPGRGSSTDNDGIKQAVMTYGAVTTGVYTDTGMQYDSNSSYYNAVTAAFYYNGDATSNHIVAIVGWDDSYSKTNFKTQPPGGGAFIVKNSWAAGWGDEGYYYVSYYDRAIGLENVVFSAAEPPGTTTRIYQYDPLGQTGSSGYGTTTAWFSNIFVAQGAEQLRSVAFHTLDLNTGYEVYVYTGVSNGKPRSGTLTAQFSGMATLPGYHTVNLPAAVTLTAGSRFSVVVKVINSSYTYPVPLEKPLSGYALATASTGQSFMSPNGDDQWIDVSVTYSNTNVCLKAFSTTGQEDTTPPVVNSFALPATAGSLQVTLADLTASDNVGIELWCLTQAADPASCSWTTGKPSSYRFPAEGSQTLYAFVQDAAGTISASRSSATVITLQPVLTVITDGDGTGTVTSNPSGISCTTGDSTDCSRSFVYGQGVVLSAAPSKISLFTGWSSGCSGTGSCSLTMTGHQTVGARFSLAPKVRDVRSGATYNDLETALDQAAAGDTLLLLEDQLVVAVPLTKPLTFKGGYSADFSVPSGFTVLSGSLVISDGGSITVDRVVVR